MASINEVKTWSDQKLVEALRDPARERFPVSYTVLLAEATARMLEDRLVAAGKPQRIQKGARNADDSGTGE